MKFEYLFKTDIGTKRKSNQDFLCAETVDTAFGKAFLGVVCDGMGGLSFGEYASRTAAGFFTEWFRSEFRYLMSTVALFENLRRQWSALVEAANRELLLFGKAQDARVGTTLSLLLLFAGKYYVAQVGDSRVYLGSERGLRQLTTDHSYVTEMAEKGLLTRDEARISAKRNELTRCIGATEETFADYFTGDAPAGAFFVLSSDGFHGRIKSDRLSEWFAGYAGLSPRKKARALEKMIERKKELGEKDNLSVLTVLIKEG